MKVLVTGASGMIGSFLVKELLSKGYNVIGLDLRAGNIEDSNYKFSSVDLGDINSLENVLETEHPDRVIHLAALAHPVGKSQKSLQLITHLNVECAENIFKICNKYNIPILFISTIDVFGMTRGVLTPDTKPNPISNYGKTKYQAENKLKEISTSFDIFRFSPVYTSDIKRDIEKRYYIKSPKWAYKIGNGGKFEVLNISKAVSEMANWCEKKPSNKIHIIKDENLLDINEIIKAEQAEGRASHILYFPKWLVKAGYYCLYPILRKSNPLYLIFKAIWPFRTTND